MKRILMYAVISLVFGSVLAGITCGQDININSDTTWEAGEYNYNNVLVTGNATLTFNGAVTLNATNITVDLGSSISADYKG